MHITTNLQYRTCTIDAHMSPVQVGPHADAALPLGQTSCLSSLDLLPHWVKLYGMVCRAALVPPGKRQWLLARVALMAAVACLVQVSMAETAFGQKETLMAPIPQGIRGKIRTPASASFGAPLPATTPGGLRDKVRPHPTAMSPTAAKPHETRTRVPVTNGVDSRVPPAQDPNIPGDEVTPVPDQTAPVVQPSPEPFAVKLETVDGRKTYRIGQPITFVVTADIDCYLYLVDVGTDRKTHLLFPNKWQTSNNVQKGVTYRIPPEEGKVIVRAYGPEGTEYVKAIATLAPMKSMSDKVAGGEEVFPAIVDPVEAWLKIEAEIKNMPHADWSEDQMAVEIVK